MPMPSQFKSACKDCGKEYDIGDDIDTNGCESPNKHGEMKAHWCPDGKNCQGAVKEIDFSKLRPPEGGDEPSPVELLDLAKNLLNEDTDITDIQKYISLHYKNARVAAAKCLIAKAGIDNVMDLAGIKHPSRVAFTYEVMEDLRK